jgi:6-phosphogluconolactonase
MKLATLLTLAMAGIGFAESTRVYIGTGADGIYTTELNLETGEMTGTKMAFSQRGTGFLEMRPDGKMLYSTAQFEGGKGGVRAYRIDDDGSLHHGGKGTYNGRGLCHVSLGATNKILLGADYGGGKVASFALDKKGAPGNAITVNDHKGSSVNSKRQEGPHAHSFYAGPDNKFGYAPDLGIDKVMIYKLDLLRGSVEEVGFAQSPPGAGPRHMKFGKDGKQAFVLNELKLSVSVYDRNPKTGALKIKETVSVFEEGADGSNMSCSEIRISKDGKFAYAANRDLTDQRRDSVSVFEIGEGGKLKLIQVENCRLSIPRNINLDPSGKWLLVAGQKSNEVTSFKIDAGSGKLIFSGHRTPVPTAMCIEFSRN